MQPLLVILEDLHWIDPETQALLDRLVDTLPTARILLLVDYRPEYSHDWSGKTYSLQLQLGGLSLDSTTGLLDTVLGTDPSLDPLKRTLVETTEGNPFFLEESIRTLVETGLLAGVPGHYTAVTQTGSPPMPATIHAVLAARIDRLTPDQKLVLATASVIGRGVPLALLHGLVDMPMRRLQEHLADLQAAELLYEESLFPGVEYTFKHALTREVAYDGLLDAQRCALHARAVEAIETLHPDRLIEYAEAPATTRPAATAGTRR